MLVHRELPHIYRQDVRHVLYLCAKNFGFVAYPSEDPQFLTAYLRVDDQQLPFIEKQEFYRLVEQPMRRGPILYVALFIAPRNGAQIARDMIRTINPQFVARHVNGRFHMRQNPWFKESV